MNLKYHLVIGIYRNRGKLIIIIRLVNTVLIYKLQELVIIEH